MASGQESHWLIESPQIFHLCVIRPPEIFTNLFLNMLTQAAFTQSADNGVIHL